MKENIYYYKIIDILLDFYKCHQNYQNEIYSRRIATKSSDNAIKICPRPATFSIIVLGEKSKGYIPATHQETNCRLVSYENEISRFECDRPPGGVGPRESDFEVPLVLRKSLLEQMAGTFFVIYSYSPVSPTYSSASSLFFPFTRTPSHFQFVRVCDNIEKDFTHVLSNSGFIAQISNVKYAFEMKKRVFGFTFHLMELIRR